MVDPLTARRWTFRAIFVSIAAVFLFVQLLPFNFGWVRVPGPDLLVLLVFAWVLRRPDYLPLVLIAAAMLLADMLLMRPLGLWTALTLVGAEFLRNRGHISTEMPFALEWFLVGAVLMVMSVAQGAVLFALLVPQPPFSQSALQVAISLVCYPLVVMVSSFGLGVRVPTPSERDALGGQT